MTDSQDTRGQAGEAVSALGGVRLSFVGVGVMAEAMIAGLLSRGLVAAAQVAGSHPRSAGREELTGKYGIAVCESSREAAEFARGGGAGDEPARSGIVILSVKPQ